MGNVGVDCARILLSPIDQLAKTDITQSALERLSRSRIRHVTLVARRGPLQASFTIKELRELVKLNSVRPVWNTDDFSRIDQSMIDKLERPRKRLTELMLKIIRDNSPSNDAQRLWHLQFWRRPKSIHGTTHVESVEFERTESVDDQSFEDGNLHVRGTGRTEFIPCGLLIKSIGYIGVQVSDKLEQRNFIIS